MRPRVNEKELKVIKREAGGVYWHLVTVGLWTVNAVHSATEPITWIYSKHTVTTCKQTHDLYTVHSSWGKIYTSPVWFSIYSCRILQNIIE